MALSIDNNHAESYNNLGVLELRRGRLEQARAFFQAAFSLAPQMYEPHYNAGMMSEWVSHTTAALYSISPLHTLKVEIATLQIIRNQYDSGYNY